VTLKPETRPDGGFKSLRDMATDPIVEFAQFRFGTDAGLPADAVARAPLPDWMAVPVGKAAPPAEGVEEAAATGEAVPAVAVPVDVDNPIIVEGRVVVRDQPGPAADGITGDVLAYYLPFHYYRTAWGIYIRAAGLWALARRLALPRKVPNANFVSCAYSLLLDHERLHFFAEYAASRVELITAVAHYDPYFKRREGVLHEEALANAYALRRLRRSASPRLVRAAADWMATQGRGYCDFRKWLPPNFAGGERTAACFITIDQAVMLGMVCVACNTSAPYPAEFLFRNLARRQVPTYVVLDHSIRWIRVVKPFPKDFGLQVHVHANDHKPPHIHVECPPGTPYSRYQWPDLNPLRGDPRLGARDEKRLEQYVALHGAAIGRKIAAIPWK